jgi:GNAT superfamily N-acetyltransferase
MSTERNAAKGDFSLRPARAEDWEEAMELAWQTFLIYEAGDYSAEGIESFRDFISDQWLKRMFLQGEYKMFVALDGEKIIGFISLRNVIHISLLFVHKDYHHLGVGSGLIEACEEYLSKETQNYQMTVNAAPYAEGFYHKLGFRDLAEKQCKDGIIYTPMRIVFR